MSLIRPRTLAFAASLLSLIGACGSPPPDTSPVVTIVTPVQNARFSAGQPIKVGFTVGGKDGDVPFKLVATDGKTQGQGRVVALLSNYGNLPVAVTNNPADDSLNVPDGNRGVSAAEAITKANSPLTIELWLQYNNGDFVTSQRKAAVNVIIE